MAINNRASILEDEDDDVLNGLVSPEEEDVDPDQMDLAQLPEGEDREDDAGDDGESAPIIGEASPQLQTPVSGLPPTGSGVVPPSGPIPPSAQDRYQQMLSQAPQVYQRKPPGLAQKLGAIAAGAAAGWNNANPRARPIDPSEAIQGILYPGQARREQQYQIGLGAAKQAADAEREQKIQQGRVTEYNARAGAELARGQYYKNVDDTRVKQALDKGQTPLEKYTALMQIPGMATDRAITLATTGKDLPAVKAPAGLTQVNQALGEKLGIQPNEKGEYWAPSSAIGANLKVENPPDRTPKTLEERINQIDASDLPQADKDKQISRAIGQYRSMHPKEDASEKPANKTAFREIEERHQAAYQNLAREKAERSIPGSSKGMPMTQDEEIQRKQAIENAYAAEIRAAGGSAAAYQFPQPKQNQPTTAQGGGKSLGAFPRAHLAGFMQANGYTDEAQAKAALLAEGFSGIQ